MKTATIRALALAVNKGARVELPAATAEQPAAQPAAPVNIDQIAALCKELIADAMRALPEPPRQIDVDELRDLARDHLQQIGKLADTLAPADLAGIEALLAGLGAAIDKRLRTIELRLDALVQMTANLSDGQRLIVATLNQPVVPEYDADGRVIAAVRMPQHRN